MADRSQAHLPGATPWPADLAARWRTAGYWTGQTFTSMLFERAYCHPDRIAVVEGERRTSYARLLDRSQRLARGLRRLGLRRRDRVLVQLGNVTEFFDVCFALYRLGAIPVFALPAHRASEIGYFLEHTQARCYILAEQLDGADLRPLASELLTSVPSLDHVLVVGSAGDDAARDDAAGDDATAVATMTALAECYADPDDGTAAADPFEPVASNEVALLQLSGGSTGLPKLIPRTHDEYLYTLRESARICGLDSDSRYLAVLPIAHNYPMSSPGCFGVLCAGGQVVLADGASPDVAFELIERERITITALVPPLAFVWLAAAEAGARGRDLSSLRVVQVGGAPLPQVAARRVRPAFGATLQQVFGMAEGLVNYTRLDDPEEVIVTTQGRPISPDDEIRVVDDGDELVAAGAKGHLLTRGPYTIRGYYRADAHNEEAFTSDGFYRTGDIVSVAEAGYLRVEGRAKDQINRGGEKIAPDEVEDLIRQHCDVHDVAVIGTPDEVLGERSHAFVVARGDARVTRRVVAAYLTERGLAAFKIPDRLTQLDSFPVTAVGKTSRRQLRAVLSSQLAATSARRQPQTEVSNEPNSKDDR